MGTILFKDETEEAQGNQLRDRTNTREQIHTGLHQVAKKN